MPTTTDVITKIHDYIREIDMTAVVEITPKQLVETQVNALILDSLQLLELGMKISDEFGTEVDILELPSDATFGDVAASLTS